MVKDELSLIISDYNDFHGKSSFSGNSLILCGSQEGDPLSPPEGEAIQGEHPLTPTFVKVFHQPSDDYRTIGECPGGGGGSTMCRSPQERLLVSLKISTKPLLKIVKKPEISFFWRFCKSQFLFPRS
jgi:hypothetical protein